MYVLTPKSSYMSLFVTACPSLSSMFYILESHCGLASAWCLMKPANGMAHSLDMGT